jgi:hypothetical protein
MKWRVMKILIVKGTMGHWFCSAMMATVAALMVPNTMGIEPGIMFGKGDGGSRRSRSNSINNGMTSHPTIPRATK